MLSFSHCHIAIAFLHYGFIAAVYFVDYPFGNVLGSGIKRQQFVEVAMVEITMYAVFHVFEVDYHTVVILPVGGAIHRHLPVVPVLSAAFALVGKSEIMAC